MHNSPMHNKDQDFQKAREQFRKLTSEQLQEVIAQFKRLTPKEYAGVLAAIRGRGQLQLHKYRASTGDLQMTKREGK